MARMARPSGWSSRLISNEQLVISNRPTRSVIPSAVEESPRSRQGQQRLQHAHSEEILRYTQDDKENGNNKSVILNEVKNLSVSTTNECRTGLEILRYTQDDKENGNETKTRSVIPSAVEESPRSRQGQQRLQHAHSEEILRYTQDDKENGNNKSVILNEVKNLSVSTTNECRTGLEILRYTQDDKESGRLPRL